ncbi:MAG: cobalt-precorrin 5A hydrolase [Desulfovibrio sp.]
MRIAIYALTRDGADTAGKIHDSFADERDPSHEVTLYLPERYLEQFHAAGVPAVELGKIIDLVAESFSKFDAHIFVTAAGIAVRSIALHLNDKTTDPAVVVLDQYGKHVVSLLAGHLGGANALSTQVARITGGTEVLTTATDTAGKPSFDMVAREYGLSIGNIGAVKDINSAILDGEPLELYDPDGWLTGFAPLGMELCRIGHLSERTEGRALVYVHWKQAEYMPRTLFLMPPALYVGMGCRRGVPSEELRKWLFSVLEEYKLIPACVAGGASIDAKSDELGLLYLWKDLDLPIEFYSTDEIEKVSVPTPSATVQKHMGVESVAEACAVLASGGGELIVPKQRLQVATVAIAVRKPNYIGNENE